MGLAFVACKLQAMQVCEASLANAEMMEFLRSLKAQGAAVTHSIDTVLFSPHLTELLSSCLLPVPMVPNSLSRDLEIQWTVCYPREYHDQQRRADAMFAGDLQWTGLPRDKDGF